MVIKFQDKETGEIAGLSGGDPKLKQPLVRSSPFDPKGGKVINDLEAEIRELKRVIRDNGTRVVELEKALTAMDLVRQDQANRIAELEEDVRKAWSTGAKVAEGLASELVDKKPWEGLGISKATYYNRKKAGKL